MEVFRGRKDKIALGFNEFLENTFQNMEMPSDEDQVAFENKVSNKIDSFQQFNLNIETNFYLV
ncbi:hypothetical protein CWI38_0077p0060 [Hamiltosporidium tvaerminnensis]|uniref:Uncharacterized protein n=1 Tax=Hamiltosporidium tvaerminnensis TaxID=1176355 RepID=A0A4Q9M4C7_9MICR|nr:hypothetical protein CWI38_0077p0060 [Hamiltosporidium tvaerminnensis]